MSIRHHCPPHYTPLEYIEKDETGVQYIDTLFVPNQNTRVVCEFMETKYPSDPTSGYLYAYGSRWIWADRMFSLPISPNRIDNIYFAYGTQGRNITLYPLNIRYNSDQNKRNAVLRNGTNIVFSAYFNSQSFTCRFTMFLFNCHSHNTGWGGADTYECIGDGKLRMYYCQIYNNGALIRDYVPMLRSDGKAGLYDLCGSICPLTNTPFYTNAGTGSFLFG